jgi:hypothetical protein
MYSPPKKSKSRNPKVKNNPITNYKNMADEKNNTGIENSGDLNSGDRNSGNGNSGYGNSGNLNSGNLNSGYWNSGDCNSGNWNSGIFNTDEPKMRSFNKDSDMTHTEFRKKFGYKDINLPLNVWCDKSEMTDEEKKSVSGWEQMGGYLKTLSYKEAWAAGWAKASDEQKKWYESLPNFDADIFFEITGIKIGEKSLSGKKVKVELDGKTYAATID